MGNFPIYRIHYSSQTYATNDAVVSAASPEKARSILEKHLLEKPFNPKLPKRSLPEELGFSCKESGHDAHREGVIAVYFGCRKG